MQFSLLLAAAFTAFAAGAAASPTPPDLCLLICYPEKPDCEAPSYPSQTGDCWTCCTPQA